MIAKLGILARCWINKKVEKPKKNVFKLRTEVSKQMKFLTKIEIAMVLNTNEFTVNKSSV